MRSSRYSALKAFKFPSRIAGIKTRVPVGPVHVQMILSDLCNQNCNFCAYRDPTYTSSQLFHVEGNYNPNRMLPFDKVIEILDDCKEMGVEAIQLTGGGEPTVYPKFQEVVDAILERGMKWALVTNGVLSKKWDFSTATWMRVSLDAANAQTYSKIRNVPIGHFEKALETIESYKCGVGFVVTPQNWTEILEAALLAKRLGASNIRIGAQFSSKGEDLFQRFREDATKLSSMAEAISDDSFEVFNKFGEKLDELNQGSPDYKTCGYQHFTTYIGADQNLYRCCIYAYSPRGLIATLKGKRFKDVWQQIAYPDFERFDARGCVRCQYNRINRNLNEVLEKEESEAFV